MTSDIEAGRRTNLNGEMVRSQCDPYPIARTCRCCGADRCMLMSKAQATDFVGSKVLEDQGDRRYDNAEAVSLEVRM